LGQPEGRVRVAQGGCCSGLDLDDLGLCWSWSSRTEWRALWVRQWAQAGWFSLRDPKILFVEAGVKTFGFMLSFSGQSSWK
jgi:hypothetical protein